MVPPYRKIPHPCVFSKWSACRNVFNHHKDRSSLKNITQSTACTIPKSWLQRAGDMHCPMSLAACIFRNTCYGLCAHVFKTREDLAQKPLPTGSLLFISCNGSFFLRSSPSFFSVGYLTIFM